MGQIWAGGESDPGVCGVGPVVVSTARPYALPRHRAAPICTGQMADANLCGPIAVDGR